MGVKYTTISRFQRIAERLLRKHYGLSLDDTRLCEIHVVEAYLEAKISPYEAINAIAEDDDLDRLDIDSMVPSKKPLTAQLRCAPRPFSIRGNNEMD